MKPLSSGADASDPNSEMTASRRVDHEAEDAKVKMDGVAASEDGSNAEAMSSVFCWRWIVALRREATSAESIPGIVAWRKEVWRKKCRRWRRRSRERRWPAAGMLRKATARQRDSFVKMRLAQGSINSGGENSLSPS